MKNIFGFNKLAVLGGFMLAGVAAVISFAASTPVQAASCTDGKQYTDFTGSIVSKDTMTISTKDSRKLCNDVVVNFSSYVAPANYNGKGFKNNPTAIPQTQFAVKSVTLKKGTTGKTTVKIAIPDECTNYQIDAYIGKVQTKITTGAGLVGTNAITGKLFQKTKSDCSVPKVKVKTCNTTTGLYETVDSGKENTPPYSTNFDNCEKTPVCNIATGAIDTVTKEAAKDTSKYAATDSPKCQATVCDTSTGTIVTIKKDEATNPKYTTNFDECDNARVCNIATGAIDTVTKEAAKDTSKYADANSDKCQATVCDTSTGSVVTINKADATDAKYVDKDSSECKDAPTPTTIASTGPAEIISGITGASAVAGAGSMYVRSRRAIRRI